MNSDTQAYNNNIGANIVGENDALPSTHPPISKDELSAMDAETIETPITVLDRTSSDEEIRATMNRLSMEPVLGFDTETKPSFQKGEHHRVALIQLASGQEVVLIRLNTFEDDGRLTPLRELLASPDVLKVGVAIHDDAVGLAKDYGLVSHNILDLRTLGHAAGITVLSLSKIYATLFGKRLSKGQRLSDWESGTLSDGQMRYGALDALAGYRIYRALEHYATPSMVERVLNCNTNKATATGKKPKREVRNKTTKTKSVQRKSRTKQSPKTPQSPSDINQ